MLPNLIQDPESGKSPHNNVKYPHPVYFPTKGSLRIANPQPRRTGKNQEEEQRCNKIGASAGETLPNHDRHGRRDTLPLPARIKRRRVREVLPYITRQHAGFIPYHRELHRTTGGIVPVVTIIVPHPSPTPAWVSLKTRSPAINSIFRCMKNHTPYKI